MKWTPTPRFVLLALLAPGCPKAPPTELPPLETMERAAAPPLRSLRETTRRAVPSLQAVACDQGGCWWADSDRIVPFDPLTLEPAGPGVLHGLSTVKGLGSLGRTVVALGSCAETTDCSATWSLEDGEVTAPAPLPGTPTPEDGHPDAPPTPPPVPPNPMVAERAAWARIMEVHGRLPFQRSVPVVHGGMVTFQRSLGQGAGRLMRVGGGIRSVDVPGAGHDVSCEGWLAPHPSGLEVYLTLWPRPVFAAYDALSLAPRWEVDLPGPAQGLFVDPGGRFVLMARTAAPDPDRLTDHPAMELANIDLLGAAALPPDGPRLTGTLLLDLAAHSVVTEAEGAFRGWVQAPGQATLLATDQLLLRLEPPD